MVLKRQDCVSLGNSCLVEPISLSCFPLWSGLGLGAHYASEFIYKLPDSVEMKAPLPQCAQYPAQGPDLEC